MQVFYCIYVCVLYFIFPKFVEKIGKLKPITVSADDSASFEIDMDLKDPSSRIFLYKVRRHKLASSNPPYNHGRI